MPPRPTGPAPRQRPPRLPPLRQRRRTKLERSKTRRPSARPSRSRDITTTTTRHGRHALGRCSESTTSAARRSRPRTLSTSSPRRRWISCRPRRLAGTRSVRRPWEPVGGLQRASRTFGIAVGGSVSSEPDYLSYGAYATVTKDFDEKNRTLFFGYGSSHDTIGRCGDSGLCTPFSVFARDSSSEARSTEASTSSSTARPSARSWPTSSSRTAISPSPIATFPCSRRPSRPRWRRARRSTGSIRTASPSGPSSSSLSRDRFSR